MRVAPSPNAAPRGDDAESILQRARHENFPVASPVLPRAVRRHLVAIYGFARLVDHAGDEAAGDRLAFLDRLEADLDRLYAGEEPQHPLLRSLAPTVAELDLPRGPFAALIEANRRDQTVRRYPTFDDLLAYCALSANPVGHLVLRVFRAASDDRVRLADRICTGLQLAEHWQDVAEDFDAGRIYLPQEDLERFGVAESDIRLRQPTPSFRRLMAFEVARARSLLRDGAPLTGTLRGGARIAVAGFVGGGLAALDALERGGYDVLSASPRPSATLRGRVVLRTLWHQRRRGEDGRGAAARRVGI